MGRRHIRCKVGETRSTRGARGIGASVRLALAACLLASSPVFAADSLSDKLETRIAFNIPAQPLGLALKQLADQAGIQILFEERIVAGLRAPELRATQTPREAVKALLSNTGLEYTAKGETIAVRPASKSENHTSRGEPGGSATRLDQSGGAIHAPADSNLGATLRQGDAQGPAGSPFLEEIIVTAEKREERLSSVPIPMTVVNSAALVQSHQLRVEDYYTKVPGLSVSLLPPDGTASVAIRGLTTGGATNPTVGLVIDDVPYGSTITVGNYLTVTDIDPNDVGQIEVLRGPQGTLYGSSSIGGLLKITTLDPSTDSASGRVQAQTLGVHNGDGEGYDFRAAGTVPLSDTFGIRASGFVEQDPGYIDNVATGADGVNKRHSKGGRLGALWRPAQDISLKLSALVQDAHRVGSANVDLLPGLGDLQQNEIRGTGGYERKSQAYTATLKAKVLGGELTSATGYSIDRLLNVQDDSTTPNFGPAAKRLYNVAGAANFGDASVRKLSQEVRFALPLTQWFEWLIGGFYTREKSAAIANFRAVDPATGSAVGQIAFSSTPDVRFREYAVFTDLTVHFTDRFDVQFGGRYSDNSLHYYSVRGGPLLQNKTTVSKEYVSQGSPLTYLVTPRFELTPQTMLYARAASGYRPGVPNINCGIAAIPCQSDADTTQNYELGIKGDVAHRMLSYDASLYYIDWKNIQLPLSTGGFGFTANEGRAKSQGLELSLESRPLTGLTLSTWVAWNDAELTESFPAAATVVGKSGDRLPYGARFSGNFSVNEEFRLWGEATGFLAGTLSYVGDRKGIFRGSAGGVPLPRQDFPGYAQLDAQVGSRFDSWTVSVFLNNATDRRGLIGGDAGNFVPFAYNYTQPRTVGLSVLKTFDAAH